MYVTMFINTWGWTAKLKIDSKLEYGDKTANLNIYLLCVSYRKYSQTLSHFPKLFPRKSIDTDVQIRPVRRVESRR